MADAQAAAPNVTLDDDDRVNISGSLHFPRFADTPFQEIEEMRRQVLEMEQDLARENEAAELAALNVKPVLAAAGSNSSDASKTTNGQPQTPGDGPGSSSVSQDASHVSENAQDEDVDSRSIYIGNVGTLSRTKFIGENSLNCRLTMEQLQKKYRRILRRVEQ